MHVFSYYNPKIEVNLEQRMAVERIVSGTAGTAPFLVHGPPGTGKTVTIVEAILQVQFINSMVDGGQPTIVIFDTRNAL